MTFSDPTRTSSSQGEAPAPRVLFVDQSGRLGGAELYLLDLVRGRAGHSHVVLLEDGPFGTALREARIPITILSGAEDLRQVRKQDGLGAVLRAGPALYRAARRLAMLARDFDLLFANTQKALLIAGLAGWWANRPVVWNLHDLLTTDHFTWLNRWGAVQAANRFATHVIANSRASQTAFRRAGGRVPSSVVYNGIDPAPFTSVTEAERTARRAEFGVGSAPLLGVFSRLAAWKGQHVLLEALSALPTAHVLLVGEALFDGDQSYASTLREQAAALGLQDRVHFAGFRTDVPALMAACDIVVHTSVAPEPFGRVIVEGMLAGRPVVATRAGGALEIIDDGHTGCLVPPDNVSALAATLAPLLEDPARRRALGQQGREYAQRAFSPEQMRAGVEAVLQGAHANSRTAHQTVGRSA